MKIILDECVPALVRHKLPHHDIVTVQSKGWAAVKNGQLLKLVSAEFDLFITSDKNLRHQQNLANFDIAIILLPSNQVPAIRALLAQIDAALSSIAPKGFVEI